MVFFVFLFVCVLFSQEHVDGIIAIVDNKIILKSDILEQTMMVAKQKEINPSKRPLVFEKLFKRTLDNQIDKFVVLAVANQDTSIGVVFDEINNNLEDRINMFIDVFGSREALEDTMNMKINDIKADYWDVVKDELLIEKYRQKYFNNISINKQEVESFFINNLDSFPSPPPLVEFSILEHPVEVSLKTKDSLFVFCKTLIDSINGGLISFSSAAKNYSQDPGSSKSGGDLGYTKRGSLLPAYERVAFGLDLGAVVGPVESVFGYHIIKLIDRVGEKIHSQHILFTLSPGASDLKGVALTLKDHKERFFDDPGAFDSLAVVFYNKYSNLSGYYVDYDVNNLPVFLQDTLNNLPLFSFSDVFQNGGAVYLIYKYKEISKDQLSLNKDWFTIEQFALQNKKMIVFKKWIKEKREQVYVKIFAF